MYGSKVVPRSNESTKGIDTLLVIHGLVSAEEMQMARRYFEMAPIACLHAASATTCDTAKDDDGSAQGSPYCEAWLGRRSSGGLDGPSHSQSGSPDCRS